MLLLALLVLGAGVFYRRRMKGVRSGERPVVTDEVMRRIEEEGRLDADEPLDWEEIREEEERFWQEEAWDEPEEW